MKYNRKKVKEPFIFVKEKPFFFKKNVNLCQHFSEIIVTLLWFFPCVEDTFKFEKRNYIFYNKFIDGCAV